MSRPGEGYSKDNENVELNMQTEEQHDAKNWSVELL